MLGFLCSLIVFPSLFFCPFPSVDVVVFHPAERKRFMLCILFFSDHYLLGSLTHRLFIQWVRDILTGGVEGVMKSKLLLIQ